MKHRLTHHLLAALLGVVFTAELTAQNSAFTYQGRLSENGQPASGSYDLVFSLHDASAGGSQVGSLVTNAAVAVDDGLFNAVLDFGANVFTNEGRWLEIAVRPSGGGGAFAPLSPRQALTAVPTALYALTPAGLEGPQGATGPAGPKGDTGPQGPAGASPFGLAGNNAYYTAGNVGLGTTMPQERLDVAGNIRYSGQLNKLDSADSWEAVVRSADFKLGHPTRRGEPGRALVDNGAGVLALNFQDDWTNTVVGGRVGIGTFVPESRLTVDGGVRARGGPPGPFGDNDNGYAFWNGGDNDTGMFSSGDGQLEFYVNASELMRLSPQGNVGIGTSTPRERLEVNGGNIRIQGVDGYDAPGESAYLYLGGTPNYLKATRNFGMNLGVVGVPEALTVRHQTGNVGIGTTNPVTALQVSGTVTADAFAGTTNQQSLEFRVNNQSALRIEHSVASPNLVGGFSGNSVGSGTEGAVIAGGGRAGDLNTMGDNSDYSAIGGGRQNSIADRSWFATIAGGSGNLVGTESDRSTIGGGYLNVIASYSSDATIAGGQRNVIDTNSTSSTIGGGSDNSIAPLSSFATIVGGRSNAIRSNSQHSAIGGGWNNSIGTNSSSSTIAGGNVNRIDHDSDLSTIAGGGANLILWSADGSVVGGGQANEVAQDSTYSTIAGGLANNVGRNSDYGTIAGGEDNDIAYDSSHSSIAGGQINRIGINSDYSAISGGRNNRIELDSQDSTVGGGSANRIGANASGSVLAGGYDNAIAHGAAYATVSGGYRNGIGTNADYSAIGGGRFNDIAVNSTNATIAGGDYNAVGADSWAATIAGGSRNSIDSTSQFSVIGGGRDNHVAHDASLATIAGGYFNDIGVDSDYGAIGGGWYNEIAGYSRNATIAGGYINDVGTNCAYSTIGGGYDNEIADNARSATIPGGSYNLVASGAHNALAAGFRARANHTGCFVWADSTSADIASSGPDQFVARASGGFRFYSNDSGTSGVRLNTGATAWSALSDRNLKKNIEPVNSSEVLDTLASIPISTWQYEWEVEGDTPHIGPMSQDFKAAFYPGRDDKSISTLEFDGVALAAIQGLNQKVESGKQKAESRMEKLEAENAELKQTVSELKELVETMNRQRSGGAK